MLKILDLTGYETFNIQVTGVVNFCYAGTIKNFFKRYYDFRSMPRRSCLYELMLNCKLKNEMAYLLSTDGVNDYFGLNRNWNTMIDIIHQFKCSPSLETIIANCEYLRPRFYSLINNVNYNYEIIVGIHEKQVGSRTKYGQASEFFMEAEKDDTLDYYICENRNLRINSDAENILLIATGTGIAPFISYAANKPVKNSWLIYGCRDKEDNLANNVRIRKNVVYSSEKIYVGDYIRYYWKDVERFLKVPCFVYVCGGINMQNSIHNLFRELMPSVFNDNRIQFDKWT